MDWISIYFPRLVHITSSGINFNKNSKYNVLPQEELYLTIQHKKRGFKLKPLFFYN